MWQAIGASAIGTGHVKNKRPCQDSHGYRILKDCIIAAAADGLGSAKRSEKGSELAVRSCLDYLEESLSISQPDTIEELENIIRFAFIESREALESVSEKENNPLRDYATTLLTVIALPDSLITGHVGDGGIVGMKQDGSCEMLSAPLKMEYANQVIPITADNLINHIRLSVYDEPYLAVALFTDGIQSLAMQLSDNTPHEPFFMPFFQGISKPMDTIDTSGKLADFLSSERVCRRTDDDKTLLILGRVED